MKKIPFSVYPARILVQLVRDMRAAQMLGKTAASEAWVKQATAKVDALLRVIDENKLSASAEWTAEKRLANIMCIRDAAQWLYAMDDLAAENTAEPHP